jgi:hypothetical protein
VEGEDAAARVSPSEGSPICGSRSAVADVSDSSHVVRLDLEDSVEA